MYNSYVRTHFVDMGGSSGEVHDLGLSTVPSTHHTGSVILLDWHANCRGSQKSGLDVMNISNSCTELFAMII